MKLLPLLLYCITSASIALHAQNVIAYSHHEKLYQSIGNTPTETVKYAVEKPITNKMDQTRIHTSPIGNFLNLSHQYPKNSFYQILNDKGVPFLTGRLTLTALLKLKVFQKEPINFRSTTSPSFGL